jgi:dTDP-4-dehydrorhamnose reductase
MNIVIFGGNGQLGRDCRTVFETGHRVAAVDIDTLDITNIEAIGNLIRKVQPEVLVNCAAFTQVDKCEILKEAAWSANVTGPENLSICAKEYGARLIHISTDYVFDGQKKPPEAYIESDAVNPLSYYGKTKLEGERAIEKHNENFVILRTAWLYGFHGNNFLKTILKKALSGASLKVVDDQFGSPTWSYRLACQIKAMVENTAQGVYHATSEGYCTWFDLAKYFLEKMNVPHDIKPCATEEYPLPAPRPGNSILENRKLKAEGLNVMKHWQEDLDEFIKNYGDSLIREFKI